MIATGIFTTYQVDCFRCGTAATISTPAAEQDAIRQAKDRGWTQPAQGQLCGGEWFCPACWQRDAKDGTKRGGKERRRDWLCAVYGLSHDELRLLLRDQAERRRMTRERPRLKLCVAEVRERRRTDRERRGLP